MVLGECSIVLVNVSVTEAAWVSRLRGLPYFHHWVGRWESLAWKLPLGIFKPPLFPLPLGQFINLYKEEAEMVMSAQLPVGYAFTILV